MARASLRSDSTRSGDFTALTARRCWGREGPIERFSKRARRNAEALLRHDHRPGVGQLLAQRTRLLGMIFQAACQRRPAFQFGDVAGQIEGFGGTVILRSF